MNNLKTIRLKHGKTQSEIAEILNVSTVGYGQYERHQREPNLAILKKLSKYYNTTIDKLVDNEITNNNIELTPIQTELIKLLNMLTTSTQLQVYGYAQGLYADITNRIA